MTVFHRSEVGWKKQFEVSYFEVSKAVVQGNWELDLTTKQLYWSPDQFRLYGYEPNEITLDVEFFLLKTTHNSEVKRINKIIEDAVKSQNGYHFKSRIVKKDGRLGFAETNAIIIRGVTGEARNIVGTTIDLEKEETPAKFDYNNPKYFNHLYCNYRKAVTLEIFKMTYDQYTAQDLCQEVFLKAWQNMSLYNPDKGELYTWLISIAKNHCKDYLRSKYFRAHQVTDSLNHDSMEKAENYFFENDGVNITELLLQLTLEQREIIELLFIKGYTQQEVSKIRKLPLGTVKSKSRLALKILRDRILRQKYAVPAQQVA